MAQETNQSHQGPLLCSTGCGFYSNPRNNGMCSVCYKDFLQRQNSSGCVSPLGPTSSDTTSVGESLLAQCSDSATVTSPAASSSLEPSHPEHCSEPSSSSGTSGTSEEDTSTGESPSPTDLSTVDNEQEEEHSAGGSQTVSAPLRMGPRKSPHITQCSERGKRRKHKDTAENVDVTKAGCSASLLDSPMHTEDKPKAKKTRCFTCRKKVGLTGFDCRCGKIFCCLHRYSDVHNCTFDYKADAMEKIRKENPVIKGEKIKKI